MFSNRPSFSMSEAVADESGGCEIAAESYCLMQNRHVYLMTRSRHEERYIALRGRENLGPVGFAVSCTMAP